MLRTYGSDIASPQQNSYPQELHMWSEILQWVHLSPSVAFSLNLGFWYFLNGVFGFLAARVCASGSSMDLACGPAMPRRPASSL
jgi:hypothetical protein